MHAVYASVTILLRVDVHNDKYKFIHPVWVNLEGAPHSFVLQGKLAMSLIQLSEVALH